MAKNKNNNFKNKSKGTSSSTSKSTTSSTSKSNGSLKDSHAQVPDKGSGRSGPGGE